MSKKENITEGYQPSKHPNNSNSNSGKDKFGYQPANVGDNPTNKPKPPGNE